MHTEREIIQKLESQIECLKEEKRAFEQNEKMFQALVETAVGDIGHDFFNNIVIRLSEWLNAECVIIGQLVDENKVEGFPMYLDGEIIQGFTYTLKNTPCDLTSKKGYCVFEDNLNKLYPKSKDVQDMQAVGYVGTALYNKEGLPNGILCAMSRKKLELPPQAEAIMKIVGARITSEIERIKAQNRLEKSETELRISNASKDKFFSIIAHDLKDPFNSLLGFSDLLVRQIEQKKTENIMKYARYIQDISEKSYTLLTNLLDWSRAKTGDMKFDPENINLYNLICELIAYFRDITRDKKIKIDYRLNENEEIYADKNMLNTIIRNLFSNAIKYTPVEGLITISVVSENNNYKISVKDTGIGMDHETLNNLFKIEETNSTPGLNNEKGTGLGLLLCKDFVEKHGGNITVESEINKGTSFTFTLPKTKLSK